MINGKVNIAFIIVLIVFSLSMISSANEPITFVVHGNAQLIESYEKLFEKFTEETGIQVEILHVNSAHHGKWERIIILTAGGVSPDVVSGVSTEFGEYASTGMLEPLDPLIEKEGLDKSLLISSFAEALQLDGKQYILPYGSSAMVMMFNQDHFDEAGISAPSPTWNDPDWSWDRFVDTAKKLTRETGDIVERWGVGGYPVASTWHTFPHAFGGAWVSDDLRTFRGTDDEVIASLQGYSDLAHVHKSLNPSGSSAGLDDFTIGRASIIGTGTWVLPRLDVDIPWDFAPWFKYADHDPAGVLFPIGHGVLSASNRKEEAWTLVKWLIWNEQANFEYAVSAGAIPSLMSNLPQWIDYQQNIFGRNLRLDVVADQAQRYNAIVTIRKSPAFSQIERVINPAVRSVLNNQQDAKTAMEQIQSSVNHLLRDALDSVN